MPEYPPLTSEPPPIWDDTHIAAAEQAMRDLAVEDWILKKCEACKVEVGETRKECDRACEWLQNFLAQQKGQQGSLTPALGG